MTATKSRRTNSESAADKMLKRIREHGRIIPRDRYRTYDCQRKELHDPVLEHLIKTGQARCVDGFVEAAETEPINQGTLRPKDSGAESG